MLDTDIVCCTRMTRSYLLNKDPSLTCKLSHCVLTVEHILCTCANYEHNRKQYFFNSQLSHILLHSPKRNTFSYLTDVDFMTIRNFQRTI